MRERRLAQSKIYIDYFFPPGYPVQHVKRDNLHPRGDDVKVSGRNTADTNYNELETINRKLRAIHRLRGIIFRKKKGSWDLADICETLTRRGAYASAWIALTGPGGQLREFAEAGLKDLLGARYDECADHRGPGFSTALVKFLKTGEPAAVNRDPLLLGGECAGIETPDGNVIILPLASKNPISSRSMALAAPTRASWR